MNRTLTAPLVALALLTLTTGCFGDSPTSNGSGATTAVSPTPSTAASAPSEEDVAATLTRWMAALSEGDGKTACTLVTGAFAAELVQESVEQDMVAEGTSCAETIATTSALIEVVGGHGEYTVDVVTVQNGEATAAVNYADEGPPDAYILHDVDGRWLLAGDVDTETTEDEAFAETSARWTENWCNLEVGMTRDEVKAMMGDPTSDLGLDQAFPQAAYGQGGLSFVAFFDTDDRVQQLQGDYDSLGKSDRAAVTCPEVRR